MVDSYSSSIPGRQLSLNAPASLADVSAEVCAQVEALEEVLGASHKTTLLKLYATDALDRETLGTLQVRLDQALLGAPLWSPERLSWTSSVGIDRFGIFAKVQIKRLEAKLRYVPSGQFTMGADPQDPDQEEDEGPRHEVALSGFWLSETLCTAALWAEVMEDEIEPSQYPIKDVSWDDCQRFLSKINAGQPALGLTLPSEAQWEYAARSDRGSVLGKVASFEDNNGIGPKFVKSLAPNSLGLFDMLGNLYEWCEDRFEPRYSAPESGELFDPRGPAQGEFRVMRGGAWCSPANCVRATARDRARADFSESSIGFRFARPEPAGYPRGSGSDPS